MSVDLAAIDSEVLADAEAILAALAAGHELDAEIVDRVQARTDAVRRRILQQHGPLDLVVPTIREFRDQ